MAATSAQTGPVSKRRKFVADGVFYAELNEFFQRELAEEGYSGVEVRVTPTVTDISKFVLGIHKWTVVAKAFGSHPRNTYPRSPRRARSTHSRAHIPHSEALQISRKFCVALCGQGSKPWSFRRCPMRVPALQTPERIGCEEGLLWCSEVYHGEWSQGLRSRGIRKAARCSCQEHEIHREYLPKPILRDQKC